MPLFPGIFASSISGHLTPVVVDDGSYFPLGEFTLASAQSTVEFTNIPQTYTHLQVRMIGRLTNTGSNVTTGKITVNSTTSTNMAYHRITGDGATVSAYAYSSYSGWEDLLIVPQDGTTADTYSAAVLDILDYANTNKNKTMRLLSAADVNGSGRIIFGSGLVNSTTAISSITFSTTSLFKQHSHFALYGVL